MMKNKKYPSTHELIVAEIDRLHQRGKGASWKSLMEQVDGAYKPITYNFAQMIALHLPATVKEIDMEWGRGTGKTTVMASFTRHIAQDLGRGVFQWLVPTYAKFLTEIIPAYIHALEMQGLFKGLHYFIGQRPPRYWNWPEPYKPPLRYDNFIVFWTGFGIQLISQDVPGAGRGMSTDGEFADEVAMLNKRKMDEDTSPSIRGSNIQAFQGKRWFDFRLKASSTPITQAGEWFTEREQSAILTPDRHRFLRANCLCNLHNLKANYLEDARRDATDLEIFNAEYLNIRPRFVRGGFYALLDEERHTYTRYNYNHYDAAGIGVQPDCRGDGDLTWGQPLVLGMDFGSAINSLVVCQHVGNEFRALKNFYAKGQDGKTQDDVCEAFHAYYQYHDTRTVYLWYDLTGNSATGNTKLTRAQQAESLLTARGWRVVRMSVTGTNPRHFEKYRLWERILQENEPRLPRFRLNIANCRELYVSMSRAKKRTGAHGETKKDKSSERVDNPRREYATDLSDAVDQPVFGMFNQLLRDYGAPLPDGNLRTR